MDEKCSNCKYYFEQKLGKIKTITYCDALPQTQETFGRETACIYYKAKEGGRQIMPKVIIDMEMPKSCSHCKYKEGAYTDERYTCKLLNITFPAEYICRFALCPFQEVKE